MPLLLDSWELCTGVHNNVQCCKIWGSWCPTAEALPLPPAPVVCSTTPPDQVGATFSPSCKNEPSGSTCPGACKRGWWCMQQSMCSRCRSLLVCSIHRWCALMLSPTLNRQQLQVGRLSDQLSNTDVHKDTQYKRHQQVATSCTPVDTIISHQTCNVWCCSCMSQNNRVETSAPFA
jgi:hypothetical protein